jgi:hypothetical protein
MFKQVPRVRVAGNEWLQLLEYRIAWEGKLAWLMMMIVSNERSPCHYVSSLPLYWDIFGLHALYLSVDFH